MIVPALIVGFARDIQVVMQEVMIIDTILFHPASTHKEMPKILAVEWMLVFQTFLNFFIPSASGQAPVSMPLMVTLPDLLNIPRQTAALAFISGDGFSKLIIPKNAVLIAILEIAGVTFEKWYRYIRLLFVILSLITGFALIITVMAKY